MASTAQASELTDLLRAWGRGEPAAAEQAMDLVYGELRRQAARRLRRERRDHTLQPSALVHEVYLKLFGQSRISWRNRAQFFGVAAEMMRRILVDHARQRRAGKRAGGWQRVSLAEDVATQVPRDVQLVALDSALVELARLDPGRARLIELRYFAGLTLDETADILGVSEATVTREWRAARAWLFRRIKG